MSDDIPIKSGEFAEKLYSSNIAEATEKIVEAYIGDLNYKSGVPDSLHQYTTARKMSECTAPWPSELRDRKIKEFFQEMGIYNELSNRIEGPLNHILGRMFIVPRIIDDYIENFPDDEQRSIYSDPPLFMMNENNVAGFRDDFLVSASEYLSDEDGLIEMMNMLGELGQEAALEEKVYPGRSSTQAYENFGIFHLFPGNHEVDIISTSPGVILPTEADPLKYMNSSEITQKNLLRKVYFEMLGNSIHLGDDRKRKYSANEEGTAKNLLKHPALKGAAKEILGKYLEIGDRFEIRLGEQAPEMKHATLIGDKGVVYSVRDPDEKKIVHNLTVMGETEAENHREIFNNMFESSRRIESVDIIEHLMEKYGNEIAGK